MSTDDLEIDRVGILDFVFDMKVKPYTMIIRTYPVGTFTLVLVKGPANDPRSEVVGTLSVKDRLDAILIRDDVAASDHPEATFYEWIRENDNT